MPPEVRDFDGTVDGVLLPFGVFLDSGGPLIGADVPGDTVLYSLGVEPGSGDGGFSGDAPGNQPPAYTFSLTSGYCEGGVGYIGDTIEIIVSLESGFSDAIIGSSSLTRSTEDGIERVAEELAADIVRIPEERYHLLITGDTVGYALSLDLEGNAESEISPIVDGASLGFALDVSAEGQVSSGVGTDGFEAVVYVTLDDGSYAADANVDGEVVPALSFYLEQGAADGEIYVTVEGDDVFFIFSLVSGHASGEIRLDGIVDGVAFPAIEYSLEPGYASQIDDGTALGATLNVSISVQPGVGAANGEASGDRLEVVVVFLAGATDGSISTVPARFLLSYSVQPGTVNTEREAFADGADVSFALVLLPGHATAVGRVLVPGAALHFAMLVQSGSAYGLSGAAGATVHMSYRIVSGVADAPVYVSGSTLSVSYELEVGTGGVVIRGFDGHITIDLLPGVVTATGYYRIAEDGRDRVAEDGELRITESPLAGAVAGVRLLTSLAVQGGHAGGGHTVDGDDLPLLFHVISGFVGAGVTVPAAFLPIAFAVQPGHADGAKSVLVPGATLTFSFAVESGSAQGEVAAGFAILRIVYQVQAVAPAGDADVDGELLSFAHVLVPGSASGIDRGLAVGATLKVSVVLQAGGAYAGEGVVVGAEVFPLPMSLAAGDAEAIQNPIAAGKTFVVALSVIAGLALGDYAHGANLGLAYVFQPGRATGRSAMARGASLRFDFGLLPGSTLGGVSVGGEILHLSYAGSSPGYASGTAEVDGADLTVALTFSPGSAVGIDRGLAIGARLTLSVAVQAGSAVGGEGVVVGDVTFPIAVTLQAGDADAVQNPVVGDVTFTVLLSLSAGEALGDYARGAQFVLPYVFVPGRATGRSAMARGASLRFDFGLLPGATLGGVSVGGETLVLSYAGSWPGYASGTAEVEGADLSFALALSPGFAVGIDRGMAIGSTLPLLVAVEPGFAVGGEGVVVGAETLPVAITLQAGDVDAVQSPVVGAETFVLALSLSAGEALGDYAPGANLLLAYVFLPGRATGRAGLALGAILRYSFGLLPGSTLGGVSVGGDTLHLSYSGSWPGYASGTAEVDGADLSFVFDLEPGFAVGIDRGMAIGSTLPLLVAVEPGFAVGGEGVVVGAETLPVQFSFEAGDAVGIQHPVTDGVTLPLLFVLEAGEALGEMAQGATLSLAYSFLPGHAIGADVVAVGAALRFTFSFLPGMAQAGYGVVVGAAVLPVQFLLQAGDAEAVQNPALDGAALAFTYVLDAGWALGDYASGALLSLAYVFQPGRATGREGLAVGATLRFSFGLLPGATDGSISVGAETLVVSYAGSWPGYPAGEANVDGVEFTVALDLLPGSALGTDRGLALGSTVSMLLAVEPGFAVGGEGIVVGADTLPVQFSLQAGEAEAIQEPVVDGAELTVTVVFDAGDALGDFAKGATLPLAYVLQPGRAFGRDGLAVGATLRFSFGLLPGATDGSISVGAEILVISYEGSWPGYPAGEANAEGVELLFAFDLWPGFAFGVDRGLALGSTLPMWLDVEPGFAIGGEGVVVGAETLPVMLSLQVGDVEGIQAPVLDGALFSITIVLSAGEALGDYAPGALLSLAYVIQPGTATGRDIVARGATLRFSFGLLPGATLGGISVGGDTLVISYLGSWPGYPAGDANVDGIEVVLSLALLPGDAEGVTSVVADGETLATLVLLEPGTADGEIILDVEVSGDFLAFEFFLYAGDAEGQQAGSALGEDLSFWFLLEPGSAYATAIVVGADLSLSISLLVPPAVVSADGVASGDSWTITYGFLPGIGSIISYIKIVGLRGHLPSPIILHGYRDAVDVDGYASVDTLIGDRALTALSGDRSPMSLRGDLGGA